MWVTGFSVNREAMLVAASEMSNANQQINAEMSWLMDRLSALPGMWIGPAATSFYNAKSSWDALAQAHNERLAGISQHLAQAEGNYNTAETDTESSVNTISDALEG
jgi:WXG100 family type VII secretion target